MDPQPDVLARLRSALADRYTIERELGRGGMATVYLARDRKHDRAVALKVLKPDLAAAIGPDRFLREIQVTAQLHHPHILPLYDSGHGAEFLYYVMPYVEGESLRDRLTREKQLPLDDALQIAREVADALSYAHSRGVVHRDIKPENILLESGHAVVADFGIARAISAAGGDRLTETGLAVGTPSYMSPEQAAGSQDLDGRSDLYSLGCVLYEMLAGEPPFTGATVEAVLRQHQLGEPPDISIVRPAVPASVTAVLGRSLAKTPADRFLTASQFSEALTSGASSGAAPARRTSPGRSRRWPWVAVVGTAVATGTLLIGGRMVRGPAEPEPRDGPPPFTVVAAFDGSAAPETREAVRRLVMTGIDQSGLFEVLPEGQLRLGLASAGLSDSATLSFTVARELAVRGRITTVISGSLEQLGSSYALVVRAHDAQSESTTARVRVETRGQDALIAGAGRSVRDLASQLEDREEDRGSRRGRKALGAFAATPSFDAYLSYLRGVQALASGRPAEAREDLRAAVAIDSAFAEAWYRLGWAYGTALGLSDSALELSRRALTFTDRLTDQAQANIEGRIALWRGDLEQALRAYERAGDMHNIAVVFFALGRVTEAAAAFEAVIARSPFGASDLALSNYAEALVALRRIDDAEQVALRIKGPGRNQSALAWIAVVQGDWTRADTLGTLLIKGPTADYGPLHVAGAQLRASAAAARGAVMGAETALVRMSEFSTGLAKARALLRLVAGPWPEPPSTLVLATSDLELGHRALIAAAGGQRGVAQQALDALASRASPTTLDRLEGVLRVSRTLLLDRRRDPALVLEGLRPLRERVNLEYQVELFIHWLAAESFHALGELDSAAHFYERVVNPSPLYAAEVERSGIPHSFARQRLVVLYARMGRLEDARRHWEVLRVVVSSPDPGVARLLEETREALRAAESVRG